MTKNLQYTFYEIVCKDENKDFIYIGSTKDFKNRKYQHKNACINEKIQTIIFNFTNLFVKTEAGLIFTLILLKSVNVKQKLTHE